MIEGPEHADRVEIGLDRLRAGDRAARGELIRLACVRMERIARKMLGGFPGVRRWETTDDVLQGATIRLFRALEVVTPETARSFFNFAAEQIRRELIDLARRHQGPEGLGSRHDSLAGGFPGVDRPGGSSRWLEETDGPHRMARWTEFHRAIERLPDPEREVFQLIWYQGMSQAEAGRAIGVSERVVRWRWRGARLRLLDTLEGGPHRP